MTNNQNEIIIGTLLGDACITNGSEHKNYLYEFSQKVDKEDYVKYIYSELANVGGKIRYRKRKKPIRIDGKIVHPKDTNDYTYSCEFRTRSNIVFTNLRTKWYSKWNGKAFKIVPRDIILNWRIMAFWACDDGGNRPDRKEYYISTQDFSETDVEFLINKIKTDLLITANINHKDNKPIIRMGVEDYDKFVKGINPFIPVKCMSYKGLV